MRGRILAMVGLTMIATLSHAPALSSAGAPGGFSRLEEVARLDLPGTGHGIQVDDERKLLYWTGEITSDDAMAQPDHGETGHVLGDIVRHRHMLKVIDVADPSRPRVLGELGGIDASDVDVVKWGGRELVVISEERVDETGNFVKSGIRVVDVGDPTHPTTVALTTEHYSHTLAAVPGTPYVYSASPNVAQVSSIAAGSGGPVDVRVVPVLDVSVPETPVWHTFDIPLAVHGVPVQSDGCHAVSVRVDLGRAYCAGGGSFYTAGGGETFIWDISEDPLDPEWLGLIDDPRIVYHHSAIASDDGRTLFIGDEELGPNCATVDMPAGTVRQFTGALWSFDVTDPAHPAFLDRLQADEPWSAEEPFGFTFTCSAHDGDRVEDTGYLVWGWYMGGTMLIDARDPAHLAFADQDGAGFDTASAFSNWEVMHSNGYAYSSDNGYWDGDEAHYQMVAYRLA